MTKNIRRMLFLAMLVAQGMVLSYFESIIPLPFIVPGAKLGLANIITLTAICMLSFKEALGVLLLRILLVSITFGNTFSMLYAIAGGLLSFIVMYVLYTIFKEDISLVTISIVGAIMHNLGQLIVAVFVMKTIGILGYMPLLVAVALPTGFFVGMVVKKLLQYLRGRYEH